MEEDISIEKWIEEEKARLERFRTYWAKESAKGETYDGEPVFASAMPAGEWDEQYYAFFDDEE